MMKHVVTVRQYLYAQPLSHLWVSTFVVLVSFFSAWYTWGYRPLVCATHNLEERLSLCTQACEKDSSTQMSFKNLEEQYKTTVDLLRGYRGELDAQTFYNRTVDSLLKNIRSSQCRLVSFSSGVATSQSLGTLYQATVVCNGTRDAVTQCVYTLAADSLPWRITAVTFEAGRDMLSQLTLGVECLVLI